MSQQEIYDLDVGNKKNEQHTEGILKVMLTIVFY